MGSSPKLLNTRLHYSSRQVAAMLSPASISHLSSHTNVPWASFNSDSKCDKHEAISRARLELEIHRCASGSHSL